MLLTDLPGQNYLLLLQPLLSIRVQTVHVTVLCVCVIIRIFRPATRSATVQWYYCISYLLFLRVCNSTVHVYSSLEADQQYLLYSPTMYSS